MTFQYFKDVTTFQELKRQYKAFAFKYHPDREGGSVQAMQRINAEYDELKKRVGNVHETANGKTYTKTDAADRLEGFKKGADAYLPKPFDMAELRVMIDHLVGRVRHLRSKFSGAQNQEGKVEQIKVKGNNDMLMERIMKSVNKNLANPDFNVEELTNDVGISRAQLHRKMKEITGISAGEFIRNLRLEQAARLICEGKINITQVAYNVGFNNQTHFSTIFKKHFGMSPTEYAEKNANSVKPDKKGKDASKDNNDKQINKQ